MNESVTQEQTDLTQRISSYEKGIKTLEQELHLKMNISLEFPMYRILPDDVKLALAVIEKHKYVFQRSYIEQKEVANANI